MTACPIGIDYLTLYGAAMPDYIDIAARAGCASVTFFASSAKMGSLPAAPPTPFEDAALRRDVAAALRDHGMTVELIDGLRIDGAGAAAACRPLFDGLAELGARRINLIANAPGWAETVDEAAALVALAREYAVTATIEAVPTFTVGTLPQALDLIAQVGQDNFKLVIDTMHVSRTGYAPMVARIDPALIGYVQINDGPMRGVTDGYLREAIVDRWVPGEGDYPLTEILRAVPPEVVVSIEVPMLDRPEGRSDLDHVRACVAGARRAVEAARRP